jgi:hypothetical protein
VNSKIILCLALVLGRNLTAKQANLAGSDDHNWGEIVAGFPMAASLDETNGIIRCWIRNATTNELDYPSFDFGYFEKIHLEIYEATNWTKIQATVFPRAVGYYSAAPYAVKRIGPAQIITKTYVRNKYKPRPVLNRQDYLRICNGNTNEALLTEQANKRLAARETLLAESAHDDTFALDVIGTNAPLASAQTNLVKARVSQYFAQKGKN